MFVGIQREFRWFRGGEEGQVLFDIQVRVQDCRLGVYIREESCYTRSDSVYAMVIRLFSILATIRGSESC